VGGKVDIKGAGGTKSSGEQVAGAVVEMNNPTGKTTRISSPALTGFVVVKDTTACKNDVGARNGRRVGGWMNLSVSDSSEEVRYYETGGDRLPK
jgi:hypothetical protein